MSKQSSESYLSVAYDLRPAKQVERRILLDFFRRLSGLGVAVEDFRYTGMGSIHFVDHILFHKFLGIDKLVSVERDEGIEKRIKFNRPFDSVELEFMDIGEYIPQLDHSEKHIVWLDYDYGLSEDMIGDVRVTASLLPEKSFVLVTADVEPPKASTGAKDNYYHYKDIAEELWEPSWSHSDFSNSKLHRRILDLLGLAFSEGVAGRSKVDALACLSFVYSDGHKMVTLGVQLGGSQERTALERIQSEGAYYMVSSFDGEPFHISVPVLTRRERMYLEAAMPSKDYQGISSAGVSEDDFGKFGKVYRFLPSYAELLLG